MSKKQFPSDIIEQAQEVTTGWGQISSTMMVGTMNLATMSSDILIATDLESQIVKLEKQLVEKRNQRDAHFIGLWDKVKRVRSAVKGNYGDDSTQYELVGGKRLSDRKVPSRRTSATA